MRTHPRPVVFGGLYYALCKFEQAVVVLEEERSSRWEGACLSPHGKLHDALTVICAVSERDLPDEAKARLRALRIRTSWAASTGKGTQPATLRVISEDEVANLAALFVEIRDCLATAFHEAEREEAERRAETKKTSK